MRKTIETAFLYALLAVLAACAGRDFVRPSPEAFKLGQTTYAQVVQQLGEPQTTGEGLVNGKPVKAIAYLYVRAGRGVLDDHVSPGRALTCYFHNDTLVGQKYLSSFPADSTNFDETKISAIVKGRTTRAEVIRLLGTPSASYIPPMVPETAVEAIGYTYTVTRDRLFRGPASSTKLLRLTFDDKGQVVEIDYTSSGNR
jgi:hypothetical protein